MEKVDLVVRIAGESGEGIISAGEILTMACARASFNVNTYRSYPAEVRGGQSMFQMRASNSVIYSAGDDVDILVALNQEAYDRHIASLRNGGILVYDPAETNPHSRGDLLLYAAPFKEMAVRTLQALQVKNIVMMGVIAQLFAMPLDKLEEIVREKFGRKGQGILEKDLQALNLGAQYAREHIRKCDPFQLGQAEGRGKMVLSGNVAIALGALCAGCRFFAGYPITPASDILETLMVEMPKVDGVAIQVEDEISALSMVVGASFAGKKAMTATSGPGLSLMVEMLGLATIVELPLVLVDVQRAGPATGIPTKTEQGDLFIGLFGAHGDCPRIVLAPTTVEECFYQTIYAFNLAERTQMPVIILTDQALAQRYETIAVPDFSALSLEDRLTVTPEEVAKGYQRYRLTPNGLSPIGIPGRPGAYIARGLEHNENDIPNYDQKNHQAMCEKRARKLDLALRDERLNSERWGDPSSEFGIIGWGSTLGATREASLALKAEGQEPDVLYLKLLNPLPREEILRFLANKRRVMAPEINYTGQLSWLLRSAFLFEPIPFKIAGGRPFSAAEILEKAKEVR
ncbi:MAG: 2-oxoacid:acceptor oxidoreductase subunit alpha [bacterium]